MGGNQRRKLVIKLFSAFLLFTTLLIGINLLMGWIQPVFFWGIPFGVGIGAVFSVYISTQWDPVTLSPKNGKRKGSSKYIYVGVVMGSVSVKLLSSLDPTLSDYILGIVAGFMYVICGYMVVQVWQYHDK